MDLDSRCRSSYGILICQVDHGTMRMLLPHRATLASGRVVKWGNGCDGTCTADCGWCKGVLRELAGL